MNYCDAGGWLVVEKELPGDAAEFDRCLAFTRRPSQPWCARTQRPRDEGMRGLVLPAPTRDLIRLPLRWTPGIVWGT
jgi:hypothetical protein